MARDRLDNNPEVIRTIRTKKFRYIRNFLPHQPYASFYPDGVFLMLGPPVMVNQNGLPKECKKYLFWQDHKPAEELYDIENDPEEIRNLADDPAFGEVRDELRGKLFGWMIETRDLGLIDEPEIVSRAAAYNGVSHAVGAHCNNFERILETADLARLGEEGRKELLNRLDDSDSAVRFWAVTGLFSFEFDSALKPLLEPLLDDPSISVSLAAAAYFVRMEEGARAIEAFTRALRNDILWTRLRAAAYLSYCNKDQLKPMKPLILVLKSAGENQKIFGPEHDPYVGTNSFLPGQRDMIAKVWVIDRVTKRIELSCK